MHKCAVFFKSLHYLLVSHASGKKKGSIFVRKQYLVELVLLAQLHTLFPAVIALEKISSNSSELNQFMFLHALGQGDVVKVIIGVYRRSKCLLEERGIFTSLSNNHFNKYVF